MPATPTDIIRALSTIVEPAREKDIITLNMVRDLKVTDDRVSMTLMVKDPTAPFSDEIEGLVTKAINDRYEDVAVDINVDHEMIGLGMSAQGGAKQSIDTGATNLIAVASGKGGVGKSTVAANLAVALAKEGYDVGLVDADIYGPSVPTMFGVEDAKPRVNEQRKIVPVEKYGVKLLSMGFLVELDKAVIWRGPMVSNAVRQFLGDAEWGELDYLVLDLPPGTGDIQLTLVQSVALVLCGGAWVQALSGFTVAGQMWAPRELVGRITAMVNSLTFGGIAFGSWLWGHFAESYGVATTLLVSGSAMVVLPLMGLVVRMPAHETA